MTARTVLASTLVVVAACGAPKVATTGPAKSELPATDGLSHAPKAEAARQQPPPSGEAKEAPFPAVAREKLANGLDIAVVTARALPIVQVRLVVKAGGSYGAAPGVGELTAEMLKDGGTRTMTSAEVLRRVETLGSDLDVRSTSDALVVGMGLTRDKLDAGIAILSEVVREPRFDAEELKKTKARAIDEAEDAARSSGSWSASYVLWSELYPAKSPYHAHAVLPSQLAKVDGAQIREFHRRFVVPKNATLVVAGDIDAAAAKDLAQRHFGAWTGGEPPKTEFPAPRAPDTTRVVVAHRAKSVQSDVYVVGLAPPRSDPRWAQIRIATQVLGGGVASRLFTDVREQRSLAYSTMATISEVAHGEQPLVLYAGTETRKTADAVTGLLDNVQRIRTSPPTSEETDSARRYLSDIFAIRMETLGAIADMVVTQDSLGLPDGYWDSYRKQLRATEAPAVDALTPKLFSEQHLIVVAGDADLIGPELARFGEVTVLDPEKEFKPLRTLPKSK